MTVMIPVIHYADDAQAMRNAERAFEAGSDGVLLIHMEGRDELLPGVARAIKARWSDRLVGINGLSTDADAALARNVSDGLDMTWTDGQPTHSAYAPWTHADELSAMLAETPGHLLFVGVAFKHQQREPDPAAAARAAVERGMIPTTSGSTTGAPADLDKIAALREALGPDAPLGIASGVTPANAHLYAPYVSHVLVATGV